jgi:hypothetical protein
VARLNIKELKATVTGGCKVDDILVLQVIICLLTKGDENLSLLAEYDVEMEGVCLN